MPKEIVNPLRGGLPSKIYLLAYGNHVSGYEIAQKIYGITAPPKGKRAHIPPTAKVYEWLKRLENDNIVSIVRKGKKKSGITSNVEPLIKEIEKELKDHKVESLSDFERHVLGKILDSDIFRNLIKETAEGLSFENDVDAVRTITSGISRIAFFIGTVSSLRKSFLEREDELPKTQQHFDKLWSSFMKFNGEVEGEIESKVKAGKIKEDMKISLNNVQRVMLLIFMPNSLLQKLATLADSMDKVITVMFDSFSEVLKFAKNFPNDRLENSLDKLFRILEDEFGGGRNGER